MRYCCIGSEILFRCENTSGSIAILAEFSNYLFFSVDVEEWRCSGTVAHRLTLLLQRVCHWTSAGAQHVEYSVLKRLLV